MIKSKEEVQTKDEKVQAKIVQIREKRKRGPSEGTEACQAAKKHQGLESREEILALHAPVGRMTTLRELATYDTIESPPKLVLVYIYGDMYYVAVVFGIEHFWP
jgi:hypothetical protein